MDNVQNCDSYISIPSSQTYRSYLPLSLMIQISKININFVFQEKKDICCIYTKINLQLVTKHTILIEIKQDLLHKILNHIAKCLFNYPSVCRCCSVSVLVLLWADYRACVGTWATRTSWHTAQWRESNWHAMSYIGNTIPCAVALAVLLTIGGVEQYPGPGVEAESIVQVLCRGRDRNLKSRTLRQLWTLVAQQLWQHKSSNGWQREMVLRQVKTGQASSTGGQILKCPETNWGSETKKKNKRLEEQLQAAVVGCEGGQQDTVWRQDRGAQYLVSLIRSMKSEQMSIQCFQGIRTKQWKRVVENREVGSRPS
jgi:hypothetical protein